MLWEKEPLENLAKDNQLVAYRHDGFWKPMDTLRDKAEMESLGTLERLRGRSGSKFCEKISKIITINI